jgi:hypothetical protein
MFRSVDTATYIYAYTVVQKFKLTFQADGKMLESEADLMSQFGTKMGSPPTPTYTSLQPFAGYTAVVQLGGVTSNDVTEVTLEFDQKIRLFHSCNGLATFDKAYFGDRSCKVSFQARFDNDTLFNKWFLGHGTGTDIDHINIQFNGPLIASTYKQSLTVDIPQIGYDAMEHELSKENVEMKVTATGIPGTALNSLFTATVQNTIASYAS